MSFEVGADAYGRFMGGFSEPLATQFLDLLDVAPGGRVLDVGCGPGALTAALVDQVGPERVVAVDPSESFVAGVRRRLPGVDVRQGAAEHLDLPDDTVDVAAAQLVVHFLTDPVAGLREMARVTRRGGRVGACVWDLAGGRGPVSLFWRAVRDLDPAAEDESALPGTGDGQLVELFDRAGIVAVRPAVLTVRREYQDVEDWWEPYTLGVGPAGAYVAALDDQRRERLRAHCGELLPASPFVIEASAWAAVGRIEDF